MRISTEIFCKYKVNFHTYLDGIVVSNYRSINVSKDCIRRVVFRIRYFRTSLEGSVHGDVNMATNTGDLQNISSVTLKMITSEEHTNMFSLGMNSGDY